MSRVGRPLRIRWRCGPQGRAVTSEAKGQTYQVRPTVAGDRPDAPGRRASRAPRDPRGSRLGDRPVGRAHPQDAALRPTVRRRGDAGGVGTSVGSPGAHRGVSIIPLADGRAFLALEQGAGLADLEVAIIDQLETLPARSGQRTRLRRFLQLVRGWRRHSRLVFRTRSIIVAEDVGRDEEHGGRQE